MTQQERLNRIVYLADKLKAKKDLMPQEFEEMKSLIVEFQETQQQIDVCWDEIYDSIDRLVNLPKMEFPDIIIEDYVFKDMDYPEGLVYWHFDENNQFIGIFDKVLNFDGTYIVTDKAGYIFVNGKKTDKKMSL